MKLSSKRRAIYKALKSLSRPVDIQEIKGELKKQKASIDQATVYRGVGALVKKGMIEQIDFRDGKYRYEAQGRHHHHLVCDDCGDIEEVELKEGELLGLVEKKTKFKINAHQLEFFGLCQTCQQ